MRIGAPFRDVIEYCGGEAVASLEVPVIKATAGIIAFELQEIHLEQQMPGIRCGPLVGYRSWGMPRHYRVQASVRQAGSDRTAADSVSGANPLTLSAAQIGYWQLFLGTYPGSIREASAIALLAGAAYLFIHFTRLFPAGEALGVVLLNLPVSFLDKIFAPRVYDAPTRSIIGTKGASV